jgi:peptidoglycan/LPS O-acetylase OafA/YrhL
LKISRIIPAFTGVRGFASVWVVLFHLSQSFKGLLGLHESAPFVVTGFLGVDLFFILSGAVLYHVHASDFIQYSVKAHLQFLRLRLARVYPLHLFCLLTFAVIIFILPGFIRTYHPGSFSFFNFLSTLLMINNWGFSTSSMWNVPSWSLSAEWLGYLAFPFIVLAIDKQVRDGWEIPLAFALLTFLVLATLVLGAKDMGAAGKFGILRMGCEFTAGCIFCKAARNTLAPSTATTVFGLIITVCCAYSLDLHWGAVFGLGLLVYSLCKEGPVAQTIFGNPVAIWLGNISFSLYLSHWPLIQIYQWIVPRSPLSRTILASVLVAVIICVADLLYRFVEVPSRRYLRMKIQGSKRGIS